MWKEVNILSTISSQQYTSSATLTDEATIFTVEAKAIELAFEYTAFEKYAD